MTIYLNVWDAAPGVSVVHWRAKSSAQDIRRTEQTKVFADASRVRFHFEMPAGEGYRYRAGTLIIPAAFVIELATALQEEQATKRKVEAAEKDKRLAQAEARIAALEQRIERLLEEPHPSYDD